ncbi:hypothetical protein SK128_016365 [Halocaridina rubra]|uniref:Uncharacterized protein n=1 Tax=Halocaridina rubra TaxID=373956 RepID=A0AAN9AE51_HALRR
MKVYEKDETEKYRQVLVPVSSTVIPLDDLPTYKVGVGLGFGIVTPAPGIEKPDQPIKLITIHSIKKDKTKKKPGAALVEELTQEEFKQLTRE